jgi:VWFA-related protein
MTTPKLSYVTITAALACSIFLFASPRDKDSSEVKFTARTELVLIPTLVTDKSGKHVTGLKKEDFTVLENGAPQKIATFEEISSDPQRPVRLKSPGEFSNSLATGSENRRITLIVLDFINTPFGSQAASRRDLLKYLAQSVDQREPTALYTLSRSGVHVLHDFTTDPRVLVAALNKVKGDSYQIVDSPEDVEMVTGSASPDGSAGVDPGMVQTEAQRLQTMLEDHELNLRSFEQRLAITYTLEAMQQLAQALGGFPGRKSLIWAGGGFPFNVSDTTMQLVPIGSATLIDVMPLYEHTWQLLTEAQISLYPIDVRGLTTFSPSPSISNPGRNYARKRSWEQMDTQATLETFASMTGGRPYYNSNDLVKGFRDAVNDSAQYYMLGYYLDRSKTKPGWRKLAVKVDQKHVEVRARSGFFVTNATVDPENTRNGDLSSALQSPLDYTSLPLVARWAKIEPSKEPGKKHVNYEMHLAPQSATVNDADNNHLVLEFLAVAKNLEGKPVGQLVPQKIDTHVTPEKLISIRQKGVAYSGALELAPGEYTVRFVVRDDASVR